MRVTPFLIAIVMTASLAQAQERPARLRVIAINDLHGALTPWQDGARGLRGGAPAIASAIRAAEHECVAPRCVSVIVDGGDMFQGTLLSNLEYGRNVIEFYHMLGVSAAALGNHEFDWTIDTLRARMRDAHFAILGANVRNPDGSDVDWIRDDTIVERGGLKIGIIGLSTTDTPTTTMPSNVTSLRFAPLAPAVHEHAAALKRRGADVVIVTGHIGSRCDTSVSPPRCTGDAIDLARDVANDPVDVIVAGHSHQLVNTSVGDIPVVQALSGGRAIAIVDIPIGPNGPVRAANKRAVIAVVTDSIKPDAEVAAWLAKKESALAPLINRRIGTIAGAPGTVYRPDSGTSQLVAEAYRAAGHADVGIANNGGVRRPIAAGVLTYGAAFDVLPFQNHLIRLTMPAQSFRAYAEQFVNGRNPGVHIAGLRVTFDRARPEGSRITSVTRADGSAIADGVMLTVVINNFMEEDGDGMGPPKDALGRMDLGIDLDLFVQYLLSFGPAAIHPPVESNLVAAR